MHSRTIKLALAAMSIGGMFAGVVPAQAHAPNIQITGYQYFWIAEFEGGHGGMLGVPSVGPQRIPEGIPAIEPMSANLEEGIADIVNRDALPHTFTECNVGCNTASAGAGTDPAFDIQVAAGATAAFALRAGHQLEAKTYTFFCTVHPFMRGEIRVSE